MRIKEFMVNFLLILMSNKWKMFEIHIHSPCDLTFKSITYLNNSIGHLYCAVPILIYSTAHYIITDILFNSYLFQINKVKLKVNKDDFTGNT